MIMISVSQFNSKECIHSNLSLFLFWVFFFFSFFVKESYPESEYREKGKVFFFTKTVQKSTKRTSFNPKNSISSNMILWQ